MKRTLTGVCALLLALCLVLPVFAFPAGTYEGTAQGYGGEVKAVVTLSGDRLENLEVTGEKETPGLGAVAIEQLPPKMLQMQDVDIDALTGATVTSGAIEQAIALALASAGVAPDDIKPAETAQQASTEEEISCDVLVIGAGGAGLTAALTADAMGSNVVVLEKMPYIGGNTTYATGGMNAAETSVQKTLGIEDQVQTFIDDTMKGGKNVNDPLLVKKLAEDSAEAVDWLASNGAPLPEVSFSGGATNKRIHRPEGGAAVGPYLIDKLGTALTEKGIKLLLNTKATNILMNEGKVAGVQALTATGTLKVTCKTVVLATGGFGGNLEMVVAYNPALKGFVTTNAPSATGDGLVMAEEIGAAFVDLEQIQIHPTVHQETSTMITESVRGGGAILVNQEGERFVNEMLTRDVVSAAEIAQTGGYAYLVFDQQQRENLSAIEKYVNGGMTVQADSIAALAELIKVDAAKLEETVAVWNQAVKSKKDEAFGRDTGMDVSLEKAPFYASQMAPGIHHTMGGVKINVSAQVLDKQGEVIPGLFAAGEVTGGVHGANRIGGNAVADIIVFGREAGSNAAAYALR